MKFKREGHLPRVLVFHGGQLKGFFTDYYVMCWSKDSHLIELFSSFNKEAKKHDIDSCYNHIFGFP
jgi:hypothetical protein